MPSLRLTCLLFSTLLPTGAQAQGSIVQEPRTRDLRILEETDANAPLSPPTVPRGYALVIGVGRYRNLPENKWLHFSETDAEAMYRVIISQQGGAFPAENVHKLIGSSATLANIRWELEHWLPSVKSPQDRVVVYFAGHGFTLHGTGYLAAYDIDLENISGTGLPMRSIGDILATKVRAQWRPLFVDACHSGKITPDSSNTEIDRQIGALRPPPDATLRCGPSGSHFRSGLEKARIAHHVASHSRSSANTFARIEIRVAKFHGNSVTKL
jgi:Caspase domain